VCGDPGLSHLTSDVSLPDYTPANPSALPQQTNVPNQTQSVLVSIVIPAYRCAEYITEGIESVFTQSLNDTEIIVVNDGSPDTAQLEAALLPYAGRIRYFKQATKGPSGARNTGIRNALGKYIAFLDGDDYWTPDHLAKNVGILEGNPEIALVYCDCILIKDGQPFGRVFFAQGQSTRVSFESLLLQSSTISTSSVVVSREAITAAGGFDEAIHRCEDFDMWLRLAFQGSRMAYHPDAEVYHRVHKVSLSADSLAMIKDRVRVYEKTASMLAVSKEQRQIIRRMITKSQSDGYVEQLKEFLERKDYAEAREAAHRANLVESTWKLKLAMLGLRVAPRAFGLLHRSRSVLLQRRTFSRRPTLQNGQTAQ